MASSRAYLDYILDQFSGLEGVNWRPMMGEYLLYYQGRLVGGIYDDRLLVKPVAPAKAMLAETEWEVPYEGAKPMLRVDAVDDRAFMESLLTAMFDALPEPKKKGGFRA